VQHEDVMRRTCSVCSHNWNEAPLDKAERLKFQERIERLKKQERIERLKKRAQTD
jgi:predicted secreted Zn-dependent protease